MSLGNIELTGTYFLVKNPIFVGEKTAAGIFIPEKKKQKTEEEIKEELAKLELLEVLAVGPSMVKCKVGDRVFVNPNAFNVSTLKINKEKEGYFIFRESDIIFYYS